MDRQPLVSVVMPVRNGAEFLAAALQSVLRQSLAALELIVIDDDAEPACKAIIAATAASDARVRVHAAAGCGVADALNQGLGLARAGLVARMDADDVAHPERLARQHAAFASAAALAVLGSNYRVIDRHGVSRMRVTLPARPAQVRAALQSCNPVCHPATMMRKAVITQMGGYRRSLAGCEDLDLWLRVSERFDIANLQEDLLDYRHHDRQATWRELEQRLWAEVAAYASVQARRAGADLPLHEGTASFQRLSSFGLPEAALRASMRSRALEAALHAANADRRNQARAALGIARAHGAAISRQASRYWALQARLLLGRLKESSRRPAA